MIKPGWESDDGSVVLYCADCRDVLPTLGKVDAVVTDPPYGLGSKLHDGGTWSTNPIYDAMLEWDTEPVSSELLKEVTAIADKSIVWGGNYFELPPSRCWLSWYKINTMPTMADFELAWCSFDGNAKQFREVRNPDGKRKHPTQKPISVMKWCLSFIPDAKQILDPFMGSGTTGVACVRLGRKFIGIEKSRQYFDESVNRIKEAMGLEYAKPDGTIQKRMF